MAYDFDTSPASPTVVSVPDLGERKNPKDLEAIVLVLELAAIRLTDKPGSTFSAAELLAAAHDLAGTDTIEESDIKIVLGKAGFLRKSRNRFQLK